MPLKTGQPREIHCGAPATCERQCNDLVDIWSQCSQKPLNLCADFLCGFVQMLITSFCSIFESSIVSQERKMRQRKNN